MNKNKTKAEPKDIDLSKEYESKEFEERTAVLFDDKIKSDTIKEKESIKHKNNLDLSNVVDLSETINSISYDKLIEVDNKESKVNQEERSFEEKVHESEKNDKLIEKGYLSSLMRQNKEDKLIYYEVDNIYSNTKKKTYKSKLKLKQSPPILTVRDEYDNEVQFSLTENFTDELIETLGEVKRAYYGFSGPVDIEKPKDFFGKIKYYVSNNPFKILSGIFLILFIISINL